MFIDEICGLLNSTNYKCQFHCDRSFCNLHLSLLECRFVDKVENKERTSIRNNFKKIVLKYKIKTTTRNLMLTKALLQFCVPTDSYFISYLLELFENH